MLTDIFGNDVSLETTAAVESWNKMQLGFLAHAAITPTHLMDVIEREPQFAAAQALKGLFYLMLGRKELRQTSVEANAAAQAAMKQAMPTARERAFVDALGMWLSGNPRAARDRIEEVLVFAPMDSLAMKISQAISFILGDANTMRGSIENVIDTYDAQHAGRGYLLGCYAFALEETGEYRRAEKTGREGMLLAPDDAWGLHAVAHVYEMTANSKGGLDWLSSRESAWEHCNNFRYHVWWHKALMHLDEGQIDVVMDLYDNEIRKDKTDDYRDISNATSLLSRLELEGVDVGNRWEELADLSENRTEDGCLIFADLHYMLALVGGDREDAVKTMMSRMHKDAKMCKSDIQKAMAEPGIAAATGLEAFGESDYKTAFVNLSQARRNMQDAGGSHAQRDVFERLTIDAGIRSGFLNEAEAILNERKAKRNGAEDTYASVRFEMIAAGRGDGNLSLQMPAE
ncbi:tetratricopeptide repeat protein [Amylibacter sp. SFDW26]|uniref:tetratricopeptide repeat protein n=1 Tax=Amylibacter sp. SFDW26 TaxID=2652722 RepID=UPI00126251E5|nr:tetratricopeptide repeat protein [Amylibacter sp. SFDW26]KAB7616150.1 tetratricopeptide repeat protein [Amylibacter sp. SFDW26]